MGPKLIPVVLAILVSTLFESATVRAQIGVSIGPTFTIPLSSHYEWHNLGVDNVVDVTPGVGRAIYVSYQLSHDTNNIHVRIALGIETVVVNVRANNRDFCSGAFEFIRSGVGSSVMVGSQFPLAPNLNVGLFGGMEGLTIVEASRQDSVCGSGVYIGSSLAPGVNIGITFQASLSYRFHWIEATVFARTSIMFPVDYENPPASTAEGLITNDVFVVLTPALELSVWF